MSDIRNQIAEGKRKISVDRGERRSQKSDSRREKEDISRQRSERRRQKEANKDLQDAIN